MIYYLAGAFVGSVFAAFIVAFVVERFAFRTDPPFARALKTSLVAWLIVGTIAGFGMADGGPFHWAAYFYYLPGVAAFFLYYRHKLEKAWSDETNDAEVFY